MDNKKLRFLTLGTLFAVCGCQVTPNSTPITSNSGTNISSSSTAVLSEYTVTWVVDGEVTEESYLEGETPVYKYGTEKEADEVYTYTFVGWDKEIVPVVADVTYTAVYEQEYIDYVVTWVVDGVETKDTYHYGDMPAYDGTPSKAGDAQYSYTFTGWDKEVVAVTQNETYTAQFERSINEYEVTFVVDGVETKETYMYGEMPSYEGTPTKEADAQYTYTFTGWDKEFVEVTEDATYTAQFEGSVNTYTITWVVGGEETTEEYEYGTTPEFKGSTDRESAKYTYTFTGWEPAVAPVSGDQTYVAQYDEVINKFTVNFYNEDGSELLQTSEVEYDGVPAYTGETPTKVVEGDFIYTFTGWKNIETGLVYDGELPAVLGAVNYYANFDKQGKPYDLTYNLLNLDGTVIETKTTQFGYHSIYTLEAPAVEGKVAETDFVKGYMEPNAEAINFYYSELDVWDGVTVSTSLVGEGTEANPYLISSGADLAYIRDQINNSTSEAPVTFTGQYFKLTKSIDLNDVENFIIGTSETISFAGHLDGNNCSIRGINVNTTSPKGALFYCLLAGGTIDNLAAYGVVNGAQYTGGIVGRSFGNMTNLTNYVKVTQSGANGGGGVAGGTTKGSLTENCVNYAVIECTSSHNKTAGVVGLGEGTIKNCVNYGNVNGNSLTGGVIGEALQNCELVEDCVNFGDISVKQCGGGVVGQKTCNAVFNRLTNYGSIKNSTTSDGGDHFSGGVIGKAQYGNVTNCVNYGVVNGVARAGGVIGQTGSKTAETLVENCVNYGKVNATHNKNSYAGGLIGCSDRVTKIINCVNNGDVEGKNYFVGGILGVIATNGAIIIDGCTNNGNITCGANGAGGILGGPVAATSGADITNCINNGTITGVNKVGGIAGSFKKGTVDETNNVNNGQVVATGENFGDIIGSDERTA